MIDSPYHWLKALHIISFVAWMAGMLYLPRLFVYHAEVEKGSEADTMLQTMERRLYRYIMLPAMVATFLFGFGLIHYYWGTFAQEGWLHAKLTLVILLAGMHGMMGKYRKGFLMGENTKSAKFFRFFNEMPTILLIGIVLLAVLKPF